VEGRSIIHQLYENKWVSVMLLDVASSKLNLNGKKVKFAYIYSKE
jgi:hypothetical protein